ncbi:c-type cytochrome [Photobacterium leiognathi]|uniref:Cytochrome c5 family protein n=2 Tax=Photobacterium leiognathi TaxID=553611 RepID=A0A2T3M4T9_PHOLE|nr:cytochrome c5 family protein [Photobacterium leiognathi]KJF86156.1 cytochrome C [Photobacterium leiognathi]KJF96065.1 cytochrome C [Photobacterium leiognathi]PSV77234.1 cytochrome c5 family protein [Photobacterium leiognathi]PSV86923.1 cytochrome c5 family protein [Photobacterium leiognathi]GAD31194.1 putative cytochrome c5 [Photobacterium leiognathi lrivu.4.1]
MDFSFRHYLFAILTGFAVAGTAVATDMSNEAIAERIKPVGNLYLEGEAPVVEVAADHRSGEAVYNTFCAACHTSGVMGSPKKGVASDWTERLAKGKDVLADHAINGFNAMPAKGSCMDCSDEEIVAAIDHMIAGL